ncbi:Drug resistance transporter EmrB/QacA subfamily [Leucobacter sp. 7(1)]|uniref:MDR family MFS transporter n=1 Tax=Leucobacter sp. 7(1) TaxID=1255613 RepID=UPI00097ED2A0|nr:MDR family MFS transporter [Leucobacter sp. 7(1)]SJN08419.1 Drug resistance transporter EmrB/QacA subfamily [Leucobacter sp. 7(1)]
MTAATAEPAAHTEGLRAAGQPSAGSTRAIWLMLGAAFVTILNETVMGVALPHLTADLGITLSAAQWTTTAFMLTMAVVIPTTGYLLQRFTTRQIFTIAMSLFTAGTLLGALSPTFPILLGARIVQAAGTAMMMPMLMTAIMTLIPAESRGRFMGRITIVMAVAPALGPTVSGLILNAFSWRALFWFVLPIGAFMLVLGLLQLRNIGETHKTPLDLLSIPLSALGFGGLVYGFSTVGAGGEGQATTGIITLVAGSAALALFVWRQIVLQRDDRALLDLRVFQSRSFALAVALVVVMMAAMFGTLILLPVYLQNVLLLDPVTTGLLMLPGGLIMGLIAPLIGRLFDRFGPRPLVIPGAIVASAALWSLTFLSEHTAPVVVVLGHVALSLGLAMMMTPLLTSALGSLPTQLYSHGSATVGAIQQLAGAIGTALFVTVLGIRSASAAAAGASELAASADGIAFAFTVGAVLSLLTVVGAWFVRRPVAQ